MKTPLAPSTRPVNSFRQAWWALALRAIAGYGFMEHGSSKLVRGPEAFTGILHALHMPFAPLLAITVRISASRGTTPIFSTSPAWPRPLGGSGPFAFDSLLTTSRNQSKQRRSPCNCEI
jgi:hypothetical protein